MNDIVQYAKCDVTFRDCTLFVMDIDRPREKSSARLTANNAEIKRRLTELPLLHLETKSEYPHHHHHHKA